jgi:multimeric flavodoxin WrbA
MKEKTVMNVTAFVGSARKKHTYNATELFLQKLKSLGDMEYEIVRLSDHNLGTCKGCRVCFDQGEEFCQFKDDRDKLIEKITNSDGVIFASPNYSFHVSAVMKIFLDRLGFVFHRPRFFGIAFTSIVAQGIYGGSKIVKYFNFIGDALGFNVVKGCCIRSLEPITEKGRKKIDKIISRQSKKFHAKLIKKKYPAPSLLKLMVFRAGRSSMKLMLDESCKDYRHYKEKGWFEADYYYPVKLSPVKKLFGKIFDMMGVRMARSN